MAKLIKLTKSDGTPIYDSAPCDGTTARCRNAKRCGRLHDFTVRRELN